MRRKSRALTSVRRRVDAADRRNQFAFILLLNAVVYCLISLLFQIPFIRPSVVCLVFLSTFLAVVCFLLSSSDVSSCLLLRVTSANTRHCSVTVVDKMAKALIRSDTVASSVACLFFKLTIKTPSPLSRLRLTVCASCLFHQASSVTH